MLDGIRRLVKTKVHQKGGMNNGKRNDVDNWFFYIDLGDICLFYLVSCFDRQDRSKTIGIRRMG
jgi:hypothetical protein